MRSAVPVVGRAVAEQLTDGREDAKRYELDRTWRMREDDHVGELPCDDGDDGGLERKGPAFPVDSAIVRESEKRPDQ